ncbi:MAG: DUF58 domain-containing protein, partial [Endomicrobiales bacterium]
MELLNPLTMARLSALELRARFVVEGMLAGLHSSPFRGHSLEFAQHREYAYGDELRHIDWKVYARSDKFFIKQFQEETNLRAYLLLDASGSMAFSSGGNMSKLGYGKLLAAALTYLLLRQDDAAGLGVFDTGLRHFVAPNHQLSHLSRVCETLEKASPGAETGIAAVLKDFGQHMRRRSLLLMISDLLDE